MVGAVILAKKYQSGYDGGHDTWTVHRASPSAVSHGGGSDRGRSAV